MIAWEEDDPVRKGSGGNTALMQSRCVAVMPFTDTEKAGAGAGFFIRVGRVGYSALPSATILAYLSYAVL